MNKLLLVALCSFALAASAPARSKKDNVGTQLGPVDVQFVSNKPEEDLAGKPMVVEFWATWCGPCKDSIKHLNGLHAKFKDKGLVIVGISDEDKKVVREFTKSTPMDYIVASDEKARLKKQLEVIAIPHAVVVDRSGKIVWEGHPANLEDTDLEKVLAPAK